MSDTTTLLLERIDDLLALGRTDLLYLDVYEEAEAVEERLARGADWLRPGAAIYGIRQVSPSAAARALAAGEGPLGGALAGELEDVAQRAERLARSELDAADFLRARARALRERAAPGAPDAEKVDGSRVRDLVLHAVEREDFAEVRRLVDATIRRRAGAAPAPTASETPPAR